MEDKCLEWICLDAVADATAMFQQLGLTGIEEY